MWVFTERMLVCSSSSIVYRDTDLEWLRLLAVYSIFRDPSPPPRKSRFGMHFWVLVATTDLTSNTDGCSCRGGILGRDINDLYGRRRR